MTLSDATVFRLPRSIADATEDAIRDAGSQGFELFVLWIGTVRDSTVEIENVHVPAQDSYGGEDGLLVHVRGDALHELNRWLFEHRKMLVAQVHSHPTEAFHSETDDTYPMVTTAGALSIVIPNFGRDGLASSGTVIYRLQGDGSWAELTAAEAKSLLRMA